MCALSANGNHNICRLVFLIQTQLFFELLPECRQTHPRDSTDSSQIHFAEHWQLFPAAIQPLANASPRALGSLWGTQSSWQGGFGAACSWAFPAGAAANSCRGNSTTGSHPRRAAVTACCAATLNLPVEGAVTNPPLLTITKGTVLSL